MCPTGTSTSATQAALSSRHSQTAATGDVTGGGVGGGASPQWDGLSEMYVCAYVHTCDWPPESTAMYVQLTCGLSVYSES